MGREAECQQRADHGEHCEAVPVSERDPQPVAAEQVGRRDLIRKEASKQSVTADARSPDEHAHEQARDGPGARQKERCQHSDRVDEGALHYDRNGGLVRPAPIGVIGTNAVHSYYLGMAGNGHIGRLNVSHAFYQALERSDLEEMGCGKGSNLRPRP